MLNIKKSMLLLGVFASGAQAQQMAGSLDAAPQHQRNTSRARSVAGLLGNLSSCWADALKDDAAFNVPAEVVEYLGSKAWLEDDDADVHAEYGRRLAETPSADGRRQLQELGILARANYDLQQKLATLQREYDQLAEAAKADKAFRESQSGSTRQDHLAELAAQSSQCAQRIRSEVDKEKRQAKVYLDSCEGHVSRLKVAYRQFMEEHNRKDAEHKDDLKNKYISNGDHEKILNEAVRQAQEVSRRQGSLEYERKCDADKEDMTTKQKKEVTRMAESFLAQTEYKFNQCKSQISQVNSKCNSSLKSAENAKVNAVSSVTNKKNGELKDLQKKFDLNQMGWTAKSNMQKIQYQSLESKQEKTHKEKETALNKIVALNQDIDEHKSTIRDRKKDISELKGDKSDLEKQLKDTISDHEDATATLKAQHGAALDLKDKKHHKEVSHLEAGAAGIQAACKANKLAASARCTAEKKAITDDLTSKCDASTKKLNKECKESLSTQNAELEKKRLDEIKAIEDEHHEHNHQNDKEKAEYQAMIDGLKKGKATLEQEKLAGEAALRQLGVKCAEEKAATENTLVKRCEDVVSKLKDGGGQALEEQKETLTAQHGKIVATLKQDHAQTVANHLSQCEVEKNEIKIELDKCLNPEAHKPEVKEETNKESTEEDAPKKSWKGARSMFRHGRYEYTEDFKKDATAEAQRRAEAKKASKDNFANIINGLANGIGEVAKTNNDFYEEGQKFVEDETSFCTEEGDKRCSACGYVQAALRGCSDDSFCFVKADLATCASCHAFDLKCKSCDFESKCTSCIDKHSLVDGACVPA